jgi:hypothetical protein
MDLRETNTSEMDVLNTLWWVWCNEHLSKGVINHILEDLDLQIEFITFNGYKFTNKDKTITYSYDRQQKESTQ